jgi:hypothetical protein
LLIHPGVMRYFRDIGVVKQQANSFGNRDTHGVVDTVTAKRRFSAARAGMRAQ